MRRYRDRRSAQVTFILPIYALAITGSFLINLGFGLIVVALVLWWEVVWP